MHDEARRCASNGADLIVHAKDSIFLRDEGDLTGRMKQMLDLIARFRRDLAWKNENNWREGIYKT